MKVATEVVAAIVMIGSDTAALQFNAAKSSLSSGGKTDE